MTGYGIPFGGKFPTLPQNGHGNIPAPYAFSTSSNNSDDQTPLPPTPKTLQVPFNSFPSAARQQRTVQPLKLPEDSALQMKAFEILSKPDQAGGRFLRPGEVAIDQLSHYHPRISTIQFSSTQTQSPVPYPTQANTAQIQGQFPYEAYSHPAASAQLPSHSTIAQYEKLAFEKINSTYCDYDGALELIDQLLGWNQYNAGAHALRAQCLLFKGDKSGCLLSVQKALRIDCNNMYALSTKADCLFHSQRYQESLQTFEQMLEIEQNDPAAMAGKIESLFFLDKNLCFQTIDYVLNNPEWMSIFPINLKNRLFDRRSRIDFQKVSKAH